MKKHRDGISLLIQSIYSDSADLILISVKWMQLFREMFVASGESDKLHWHNIDWWYFFRWMLHRILLFLGFLGSLRRLRHLLVAVECFLKNEGVPQVFKSVFYENNRDRKFFLFIQSFEIKICLQTFQIIQFTNFSFLFFFVVTFKPTQSMFWPRKRFESWLIDLLLLVSYRSGEVPFERMFS